MEHAKFAFTEVPVFIFLKLADHVVQLGVISYPAGDLLPQGRHLWIELCRLAGQDLILQLLQTVSDTLEMVQILGDQQLYKFIKKSADPVFPMGVLFPEVLHGGAGRPGIVAQHHPSGGQKIAEGDGSAVPRVPGGYNRPAQAVVPGFRFAYMSVPRGGRVAKNTLQTGDGDATLQLL